MIDLIKNKILTMSLKLISSSGFLSKKIRHFINKAKFNQRKTIIYVIPFIDKRYSQSNNNYIFPFEDVCNMEIFNKQNEKIFVEDDVYENLKNFGHHKTDKYILFSELKIFTGLNDASHKVIFEFFPWITFKDNTNKLIIEFKKPLIL